jgi:hypothetical protein
MEVSERFISIGKSRDDVLESRMSENCDCVDMREENSGAGGCEFAV